MDYNFQQDLQSIREILGLNQSALASDLDIQQITVSRNETGKTSPSRDFLEKVYSYAFGKGIQLNRIKGMLWKENISADHKLLFHGSKSLISGPLTIQAGRTGTDFGRGFYAGETYEQAVSFVSGYTDPSVYILDFDNTNLKCLQFSVSQDWMMTIAWFRGGLMQYQDHPLIRQYAENVRNCDYVIAPIADNRMFQIIDSFINGEITDEQCSHCLAATNLGNQYVMTSEKAIRQVRLLERCYIPENEKSWYRSVRSSDAEMGSQKVKMARIQYRGKGQYIDEILSKQ